LGPLLPQKSGVKAPLLIIGGDGLIGRSLVTRARQLRHPVLATVLTEPPVAGQSIYFDLSRDPWPALPESDAVVMCAAIASQDICRQDPETTRDLNVLRTLRLIRQCLDSGRFPVFISTNLVFDGTVPLCPANHPLCPRTEYGRQKAEVERALVPMLDRLAILRLTKVFHPGLPLLQRWRKELMEGREVRAFSDYLCSPIALDQVIEGLLKVASEKRAGIWQFSGPSDISYADLAGMIARASGAALSLVQAQPAPPGLLEHLPRYTTLDPRRSSEHLRVSFPRPEEALWDLLEAGN
jgi:dTDP-4-dehydrorhamnose reductase